MTDLKVDKHRRYYYGFECNFCETPFISALTDLVSGRVKSCGCWRHGLNHKIHGMSKTSFYNSWRGMKDRCLNPQSWAYNYYGGRGINIDKRWNMFLNFYDDMYSSYCDHCEKYGAKETTLDRINPALSYSKNNCRWATRKEQSQNQEGTMRESTIITWMQSMEKYVHSLEGTVQSLNEVLKNIVGKELLRNQALHIVLQQKGLFTDADLKTALESIIAEAQADLKKEADAVTEAKAKAVEILVPNTIKADSNQETL